MKTRSTILMLCGLFVSSCIRAQGDFVIPDVPAFAVVQVQPVTILRVSSPKDFVVNLAALANVEANSPWGLEYNLKTKTSIPLSVSVASCLTGHRSLGLGLRWDIVNNVEINNNDEYKKFLTQLSSINVSSMSIIDKATAVIAQRHNRSVRQVESDPKYQEEISNLASELADASKSFQALLQEARHQTEALLWRKTVVSLAVASAFHSTDGGYTNLRVDNRLMQSWLSAVIELDTHFVFNTSASYRMRSEMGQDSSAFSIAGRILYGANAFKGVGDLSYSKQSGQDAELSYSLGLEGRVLDNYWLFFRLMYPSLTKKVIPMLELRVGQ